MLTQSTMTDRSREMDERSWWDLWNTSYRAEDNRDQISTELFAHVVSVMEQITRGHDSRVLEVACGTGTLSRQLKFSSYHGLDISPAAIEIARQKSQLMQSSANASQATYEAADFHSWSLPSQPFDVALCIDAISGFRDQQFTLSMIAKALRTGGNLLVVTPNPFVYNRIRRVGGVRLENGPVSHWHTARELHKLMKKAGLMVKRSYTIMPRGNMGVLRVINAPRLNRAFGAGGTAALRQLKEHTGLGQYIVIVATKSDRVKQKFFHKEMH